MKEKELLPSLFVIWPIMRVLLEEEKSEQNDILVLFTFMLFYKLTTVPQIQLLSYPTAGWQSQMLKDVGERDLVA